MKKVIIALLIASLFSGTAFAQSKSFNGNDWLKVDKKTRVQLVTDFMNQMKKDGVIISKAAEFYCKKLDRLYAKKPNILPQPVWQVLKTAMIMENDWKVKGQDPDTVARAWLGDKLYERWKQKQGKASVR